MKEVREVTKDDLMGDVQLYLDTGVRALCALETDHFESAEVDEDRHFELEYSDIHSKLLCARLVLEQANDLLQTIIDGGADNEYFNAALRAACAMQR